jgi:hypothetical protein
MIQDLTPDEIYNTIHEYQNNINDLCFVLPTGLGMNINVSIVKGSIYVLFKKFKNDELIKKYIDMAYTTLANPNLPENAVTVEAAAAATAGAPAGAVATNVVMNGDNKTQKPLINRRLSFNMKGSMFTVYFYMLK